LRRNPARERSADDADAPPQLTNVDAPDGPAHQGDASARGPQISRHDRDESRLAAAVRPEQDPAFPAFDPPVDAVEEQVAGTDHGDAVEADDLAFEQ
jgi:hypothetical protein